MPIKYAAVLGAALSIFATSSMAAPISVMNGSHNVDSYGTGNAGISSYGHTVTLFDDSTTGWNNALAAGNTVVIEQSGEDGANIAAVQSFMAAGGRVIALGDFAVDNFINALFGTSLDINSSSTSSSFDATASTAGTSFADDPSSVDYVSSTHGVEGGALPTGSTVFYDDATHGTAVFGTTYGSGSFFYVGHDYCCGSAAREDAWLAVLDSAIEYEGTDLSAVPLPASSPLLLAGLGGLAFISRRRKAKK